MESISLSVPPLTEQVAIASYLDEVTAAIDEQKALLAKKKELLQEQKKALIHKAVTKGLDDSVAMKPSGVDWIGDVPVGWELKRLKDILFERGEKNILKNGQAATDNILSVMKDRGVINYRDKGNVGNKMSEDITNYKVVHVGDLVVNKMNILIGSFGISPEHGALSVVYLVLRNKIGFMNFIGDVFSCKLFQSNLRRIATGILEIREAVDMDKFWQENIPLPPLHEQIAIAKYLDDAAGAFDEQCELIEKKIALLTEMRASVIHEAVTKGIPDAH